MNHTRILAALAVAGALLIATGGYAGAGAVSPETIKHKMKRVWRNLSGYKFDVACPTFVFALSRTNCTETGKNREDARAKCQARHVLCQVGDTNR